MRKIPICNPDLYIIVEGYSDKLTLYRIIEFFKLKYNVKIIDAIGCGNIVNRYLDYKSKYPYSDVLVFYDLDGYKSIKNIEQLFINKGIKIKKEFIYFVNPIIEFLWFIARKKQAIKYTRKKDFIKFIEKEFNIINYKSSKNQIDKIIKQLSGEDINNMLSNIKMIVSDNDGELPSTNILKLKQYLEKND